MSCLPLIGGSAGHSKKLKRCQLNRLSDTNSLTNKVLSNSTSNYVEVMFLQCLQRNGCSKFQNFIPQSPNNALSSARKHLLCSKSGRGIFSGLKER